VPPPFEGDLEQGIGKWLGDLPLSGPRSWPGLHRILRGREGWPGLDSVLAPKIRIAEIEYAILESGGVGPGLTQGPLFRPLIHLYKKSQYGLICDNNRYMDSKIAILTKILTSKFRTFYEATGEWPDFSKPLEKSHRDAMYEKSPLIHVDKIITPYLLLIGEKDLRVVPHYKGFIKALQARGVPCKVHTYPESAHPLEEVDVEADFAINMLRWFEKYTQKNEAKEE
jgi:acetyl esterase/lipase